MVNDGKHTDAFFEQNVNQRILGLECYVVGFLKAYTRVWRSLNEEFKFRFKPADNSTGLNHIELDHSSWKGFCLHVHLASGMEFN